MALFLERRSFIDTHMAVRLAKCVDGHFDFDDGAGLLTIEQGQTLARASRDLPLDERMYVLRVR